MIGLGLGEAVWAANVVSVGNASVAEGDSGTATLNIPVTRTGGTTEAIALEFQTDAHPTDPATANTDYVSISAGNALLPVGSTTLDLPVIIAGDADVEPDENFFLHIIAARNIGPAPSFGAAVNFVGGASPRGVAIADFNGDGRPDLVDANGNDVAVLFNTTVTGAATPSFAAIQTFAAGANPVALDVSDVNGDSKPDLVVANASGNSVSVLLGTTAPGAATPSFAAAQVFAAGAGPAAIAAADFNGDGLPDLVAANRDGNTISTFLNTTTPGAGTAAFAAASSFGAGAGPAAVAVGDLNGDGRPDLAVANQNGGTVSVLLNATAPGGTPAFSGPGSFSVGAFPAGIAIGDVNGDGKPDLAVANSLGSDVSVLLNTTTPGAAAPNFAAAASVSAGASPQAVVLRDINRDGRPDLTVANGGGTAAVLINATPPGGAVRFVQPVAFAVGTSPVAAAVADLNGDGRPDLAIANSGSANISVLLTSTGQDAGAPAFGTGSTPASVAMGDLNGDAKPDLAVANISDNSVSVLLNTATTAEPAFSARQDFAVGASPVSVAMGDVNGDGLPDLAVANFGSDTTLSVLLNTTGAGAATASFATAVEFTSGKQPRGIAFGDFNADGKPDLVVVNYFDISLSVLLNTTATGAATPSFAGKQDFSAGGAPLAVAVGDVNGDGRPDLALAISDFNGNDVAVLLNTTPPAAPTPSFAAAVKLVTGTGTARSVTLADLNADARPDLAVANADSDNVSVLLNATATNAATPAFPTKQDFGTGTSPVAVVATDTDADGRPDLALANANSNSISVLINTTAAAASVASFATRQDATTGSAPAAVAAGDVNGDGLVDLAVANQSSNTVSVLPNTLFGVGNASLFAAAADVGAGTGPVSVALGDLNGDGLADIAAANVSSHNVSVLLNATVPGAAAPTFTSATNFTVGTNPRMVARADINSDGLPDLAVANQTSNTVSMLMNNTAPGAAVPSFAAAASFSSGAATRSLALGDLNGDGKPDLVSANFSAAFGANVVPRINATAPGGAPSFAAGVATGAGDGPLSVALGDINGDGRLDLAVAYYSSGYVAVLLNATTAGASALSFELPNSFATGAGPFAVALGDLNGDGRPDLIAANADAGTVSVRLNTTSAGAGTATFGASVNIPVGTSPVAVAVGDVNGDGRPDLAVANAGSNNVSVLLSTMPAGAVVPSFGAVQNVAAGTGAGTAVLGDLNGDGMPDMVAANSGGTTASVLLNVARDVTLLTSEATGTIVNDDVADGIPDPFAFTDQSGVAPGAVVTSNAITVTGTNVATAIGVSGGGYSIGCTASFTTASGFIDPGDTVCVQHSAAASPATTVDTVLTIGGVADTFSSTTEAADTTPFAFFFTDAAGVGVGAVQESDSVTISGVNSATGLTVTGGEYSKNGGGYTSNAGTAVNGDSIKVRHTASLLFSTATDTTLTVGGVSDTFTSTTEAQDTTPDAFAFTDETGVALGSVRESNAINVAGTNSPAAISVSGGEYRVNGGAYTASAGTVESGNTVQVRHTASGTPATTTDTMLTIGGIADTFSSATVPADTTPDAFAFTDQAGVPGGATVTSDAVTVAGINTAAPVSVSGGSYSIGCTATFTTTAGSIANGQTVCVRHIAASADTTAVDTTLSIGGVTDTYTSTTGDATPAAFAFTAQTGVARSTVTTSDAITVSGITVPAAISVSGGEYSVNGGAFTAAAGSVTNGQSVVVRHASAAGYSTPISTTLTIGGVSGTFTTATVAAPADGGGGGGGGGALGWMLLAGLAALSLLRRRGVSARPATARSLPS